MDTDHEFWSLDYKRLRRLVKRYPDGKLWTFNDAGAESSSDDAPLATTVAPSGFPAQSNPAAAKVKEISFLMDCFPGARQILFVPLWDFEKAKAVAACFAVSLEPVPVFTTEAEAAFMRGFLNNVSVACSRASMAAANRQKGNFISSISHVSLYTFKQMIHELCQYLPKHDRRYCCPHKTISNAYECYLKNLLTSGLQELRSPLHGILASVGKSFHASSGTSTDVTHCCRTINWFGARQTPERILPHHICLWPVTS